jgi:hypothetical protein
MHVRWTARLIDPAKTDAVGDGSGATPQEALERLREHLRWKANSEHERVGKIDAAVEAALRHEL